MIDTFALCGKSTWEKVLLPKLFKQTMVKFSFLVTNLTFQGSDSFWQGERNWCLLGVLDLQNLLEVIFIWKSLGILTRFAYHFGSTQRSGCSTAKGWWESRTTWHGRVCSETNEACQMLWKDCRCFYCCMAELASGSNSLYFFHWFDLTFCDNATPEAKHLLTTWKWLGWRKKKKKDFHME